MNSVEIDFNGFRQGFYNARDFVWFASRRKLRKALSRIFRIEADKNMVFVHLVAVQIYVKRRAA